MTLPYDQANTSNDTEEAILPLNGGKIYVRQDGPRDAPALLLIHGSGSSACTWDPMVPLLTPYHRVIRIDLLGHGRSEKPDDGDYEVPAQGRRAAAALDWIGIDRAIVVAHSAGGYTATALAEQRPDLVAGLALISTGPRTDALIATPESAIGPEQWSQLTDEQLRQAASTAFSRPGFEPPLQIVRDVRRMTYHTFIATLRASGAYLQHQPVPDRLATLDRPLLVIFGEDDRRWRSSPAADYNTVPGAQIELLPGLGHSPNLEDPQATAKHLLPFTTRLTAA